MSETSASIAGGQLRTFIERVERLEEEIKALNADKSEVYKEAKGFGFDVPTIKRVISARKLDVAERDERDALFDLYWSAVEQPSRVHVHEMKSPDGKASVSGHPSADHVSPPASQAATGIGSANMEQGDVNRSAERAGYGGQSLPLAGQIETRTKADFVDGNASLAAREGEKPLHSIPDEDVPAFLKKPSKPLRPQCQNPDVCAGVGHKHCYQCTKAAGLVEVAA